MNPYLITHIPLLKLKTVLFLMVVIGLANSLNCNIKAVEFQNHCSKKFLTTKGNRVIANATYNSIHTMYTITHSASPAFLIYNPEERRFICFGRRKPKLVARRKPKFLDLCLFEEVTEIDFTHTKYKYYNTTKHYISFDKKGNQTRSNRMCSNKFLKSVTSEGCVTKKFCNDMRQIKHKHSFLREMKESCRNL